VFLIDVNVVVAAFRADHPQHEPTKAWFDDVVAGDEPFAVPTTVWASFLRLVTHRRVFPVPTPRVDAITFITSVVEQPNHLPIGPGPRHLALLRQVCDDADADADLVPNAVLAAIAAEHNCTIATFDRDFARFSSIEHHLLRW
jgi:hypothetical protein